jgi:nucleoside-diphosphate-sugar epimerase
MILITGGSGFVGGRLARTLRARGERVRVLALAPLETDALLLDAGVEIQYGDVTRPEDLEAGMRGVGTVYHLAAVLSSPENPARYREVNVAGTENALAAAGRNGVGHFIFVSSISVTYPRRNDYSASKAEAEERVRRSAVSWTIVRPCLVLQGLEHQAFERAVLNWPLLLLPRRGAARKRPLSGEDLATALADLCGDRGAYGKIRALGGGEIVSLREMAASILRRRGVRKPVFPVPEGLLRTAASVALVEDSGAKGFLAVAPERGRTGL